MQWLNENDEVSMEFLRGAYDRDKKDGVSCSNEDKSKYSCLQCSGIISKENVLGILKLIYQYSRT